MKNVLVELPIWCTTLEYDFVPQGPYKNHKLEIGNAGSTFDEEQQVPNELVSLFEQEATKFWSEYGLNPEYKPFVSKIWANSHGKGGWTDWHRHNNVELSATWYPKFKQGNGNLVFKNPLDIYQGRETRYEDQEIEIPINQYDLIIFPSWLEHKTQQNNIDNERLVVSMNFEAKYVL